jgi:hypothetical protein
MFCLYIQLCCNVQKHCDKFSRSNRVVGAKDMMGNQIAQICECSKFKQGRSHLQFLTKNNYPFLFCKNSSKWGPFPPSLDCGSFLIYTKFKLLGFAGYGSGCVYHCGQMWNAQRMSHFSYLLYPHLSFFTIFAPSSSSSSTTFVAF